MRTEQLTKCSEPEGDVGRLLNRLKPPLVFYITDCSKAGLLIWFPVFACFGVSFCTVFTCVSR